MRPEKQLFLEEIEDKIRGSSAVVVVKYQNLKAGQSWKLGSSLNKINGDFYVVKKRLFLKAAEKCGYPWKRENVQGHVGIAFVHGDVIETTKAIFQFSKENVNSLEVLSGVFEGKICSAQEVEMLSMLPGKKEMQAQLLSVFEAPLTQTLSVMEALILSVVYCLKNKNE